MSARILVASLTALCLCLSPTLFAQENRQERKEEGKGSRMHRASQLNGKYVKNKEGETLGHVEDIVVNMKDGSIVYVAIAHGQTLGFGGKLFAVSPNALRLAEGGEYCVMDASRKAFEDGKGFDANAWPRQPSDNFGNREGRNDKEGNLEKAAENVGKAVKEGAQDVKEGIQGESQLSRVSSIIGMGVRTPENKSLGSVYDLMLNCNDHKVAYAAVNYGATLGIGGKLIAVPWDRMKIKSLSLTPSDNHFVINTTQEQFERAPHFTSDSWPNQPNNEFWSNQKGNNAENRNEKRDSD